MNDYRKYDICILSQVSKFISHKSRHLKKGRIKKHNRKHTIAKMFNINKVRKKDLQIDKTSLCLSVAA